MITQGIESNIDVGRLVSPVSATAKVAQQPQPNVIQQDSGVSLDYPVGLDQAKQAVGKVNEVIAALKQNVEFSVDESTGIDLVKVVDKENGEVIRQLPVQAVVDFAHALEAIQGLLFKETI